MLPGTLSTDKTAHQYAKLFTSPFLNGSSFRGKQAEVNTCNFWNWSNLSITIMIEGSVQNQGLYDVHSTPTFGRGKCASS
jgi:hypothetical protein